MLNGATLAGTGSEIPPPNLPWKSRLGKYDLATIDRKVAAGQTLTGGVTLNLLQPRTWTTLP